MKQKVLIIDDDVEVRGQFKKCFEPEVFIVLEAENGEKGLALFRQESPDLVLLDMSKSHLNGRAVLQEIHSEVYDRTVPVVVFSNIDNKLQVADAMEDGSYYYLVKNDWNISGIAQFAKNKLVHS
jgi:DNA-binding response OmpR family regulator